MPVPGNGEQLYEVSAAGIIDADTHHSLSCGGPPCLVRPLAALL